MASRSSACLCYNLSSLDAVFSREPCSFTADSVELRLGIAVGKDAACTGQLVEFLLALFWD